MINHRVRCPAVVSLKALWLFLFVCSFKAVGGNTSSTSGVVTNLTVEECVHLLNERTGLQVNLEIPSGKLPSNFRLDLSQLGKQTSPDFVEDWLRAKPNFVVIRNGQAINIVWKEYVSETEYPLNRTFPDFFLQNGDLIDVFNLLCKQEPRIALHYPILIGHSGMVPIGADERAQKAGKKIDLKLDQATLRSILNEVAAKQSGFYWVGARYDSAYWKGVGISFYSSSDTWGSRILRERDPRYQQWLQQLRNESERLRQQGRGRGPLIEQ